MTDRESTLISAQDLTNALDDETKLAVNDKLIDSKENSSRKEKSNTSFGLASIFLIFAVNVANFVNGLYMAVPGPTLLFLADTVSADVSMVSTILSGRSVGNLLGAFAATLLPRNRSRFWNPTIKTGLVLIVHGLVILTIPFINNLWLMAVNLSIGGLFFGLTNTGFLAMQMDIWGDRKSRPLMQLYQGIFSIGAMVAPLIANPFLNMASNYGDPTSNDPACHRENRVDNETGISWIQEINSTARKVEIEDVVNPVTWVYVIIGSAAVLSAIFLITLALNGIEDIARKDFNETEGMQRQEEPFRKVALILFSVMCFYAFHIAAVYVFASYIYLVAYCSNLRFSISEASSLNSLYWGMIITGRLGVSFIAERIEPSKLIAACVMLLMTSSGLMSGFGESYSFVAWSSTALWALGVSPLFGAGVSWIYKITNVSGRYAVVFELGAAIGSAGSFPIAGMLFDMRPFNVIYFVCGLVSLITICFGAMMWIGKRQLDNRRKKSAAKDIET